MERAAAYPWQSPTTTVMPGYYTTTTKRPECPEKYCPVLQCPEPYCPEPYCPEPDCPAPYCPPMCDLAGWSASASTTQMRCSPQMGEETVTLGHLYLPCR